MQTKTVLDRFVNALPNYDVALLYDSGHALQVDDSNYLIPVDADRLLPSHYKALSAMKHCRRAQGPAMLAACSQCDHRQLIPHYC